MNGNENVNAIWLTQVYVFILDNNGAVHQRTTVNWNN